MCRKTIFGGKFNNGKDCTRNYGLNPGKRHPDD